MREQPKPLARRFFIKVSAIVLFAGLLLIASAFLYVHMNRDKLALVLQERMKQTFHGNVQIGKVRLSVLEDFPNFSLTLLHTTVKDSLYEKYLFDLKKIHLRVSIFDLIRRRINVRAITLEDGNVFLFKDISGYSNTGMFQSFASSQNSSALTFTVKQFFCNNVAFVYKEERLGKVFSLKLRRIRGKISQEEEAMQLSLGGIVHVDSMQFRPDKGSYLLNKSVTLEAGMTYDRKTGELNLQSGTVTLDAQPYFLSGCFIFRKPLFMNLYIDNPACDFNSAKTALTPKIQQSLSSFTLNQPVKVRVSITGESQPLMPPMVDVSVTLDHQDIKAYKLDFTSMTMHALFTNHLDRNKINDKYNSGIFLAIKSGRMEYIPLSANITISDLDKLDCRAIWKTRMDLTDFNRHDVFESFYFNKGTAELQFAYSGNLSSYKDSIAIGFNDTLNGFLMVKDAVLEYPGRQLVAQDINTEIFFNEEKFQIDCLGATLNDNIIELSGSMSGIRRLLTEEVEKMEGRFDLFSPEFDITKVLLGRRGAASQGGQKKKSGFTLLPSIVNRIINDITFDVNIAARALRFHNLTAQQITGKMRLSSSGLSLNNFGMNTCSGSILLSAKLNTRGAKDRLEAEAEVSDVDVTRFFQSADNFNQDAITHENLSGLLSAQVQFSSELDNRYNPVSDSIRARIIFSLRDGELLNYQPVMEIDNFIFRKRDMKNIRFAEITDTLLLAGKELSILKMEVASSVIRLFVKGKYTFSGPVEIFVRVPLSNLRKPEAEAAVSNLGIDEKPGASIYLKVHGEAGKLKVSLAPSARKELKRN